MSGQDILDQAAGTTAFVQDYLHIDWDGTEVQNDKATDAVHSVDGNPVTDGIGAVPLDHSVLERGVRGPDHPDRAGHRGVHRRRGRDRRADGGRRRLQGGVPGLPVRGVRQRVEEGRPDEPRSHLVRRVEQAQRIGSPPRRSASAGFAPARELARGAAGSTEWLEQADRGDSRTSLENRIRASGSEVQILSLRSTRPDADARNRLR